MVVVFVDVRHNLLQAAPTPPHAEMSRGARVAGSVRLSLVLENETSKGRKFKSARPNGPL